MKKIVLGLVCAMSFSFATTSEDNQKNVDETLKKFYTKIENFRKLRKHSPPYKTAYLHLYQRKNKKNTRQYGG